MMGFPSFAERIPEVAGLFLEKAPVAFGLGVVKMPTMRSVNWKSSPGKIMERDAVLLVIAKERLRISK